MTPFEVYKQYVSVKLHFNSDEYDYILFNGKTRNINYSAYDRRKDKYYFEKISKRYTNAEVVPFFVANFVNDPNIWSGDLAQFDKSAKLYRIWKGKIQALSRHVREDLKNIKSFMDERSIDFNRVLQVDAGTHTHPIVVRFLLQGMISMETMIYLNKRFTFVEKYDTMLIDPLWEYQSRVIKKYASFLQYINWETLI